MDFLRFLGILGILRMARIDLLREDPMEWDDTLLGFLRIIYN